MDISKGKIALKALRDEDIEILHEYASDPLVSKYIGWPLMHSLEESQAFYNKMLENQRIKTHDYAFVYYEGHHVGTVMLFNFDEKAKNAEIGYVFHRKAWGKKIASIAVQLLKTYAFSVLRLHKLYARVASGNPASCKVLENNGFIKEGCLKDHYFIDDYEDLIYYGSINE